MDANALSRPEYGFSMTSAFLLAHAEALRLSAFIGVFALLALAERRWPGRGDARAAARQWVNLCLMLINTAILRLAFPVLALGYAIAVQAQDIGLLNYLALPAWLAILIAFVLLDLSIYWQHRLLHRVPILWRLHRVHHSDLAFDTSLAVRFHPAEIAFSMLLKFAVIAALGAPPVAVLLFEIALSIGSLFSHADLRLAPRFERMVRMLVVTPDMHRVHHSIHVEESNSNFSFNLSLWDHLFRSYRASSRDSVAQMRIGLEHFRTAKAQGLFALLLNPFQQHPSTQSTDRD